MTPLQFLLVSSPAEGKVAYAELNNFQVSSGKVDTLIDSGLGTPHGIAFDRDRGFLYVTDPAAKKIFRYSILIEEGTNDQNEVAYTLVTDGNRLTILEGKSSQWVTVDNAGNVYYTDQEANSVNKIMANVIDWLADGEFQAKDLVVQTEQSQESQASAKSAAQLAASAKLSTSDQWDQVAVAPIILAMYEASANSHVSTPAGIMTDSVNVYWGNQADGQTKGAVVEGQTTPTTPVLKLSQNSGASTFITTIRANNTQKVYGIAKTHSMLVYTADETSVYGTSRDGGPVVAFSQNFEQPRGLVWDGDNTIYVADQKADTVSSLPCGRLAPNQLSQHTVTFNDAFGLAILHSSDPAFQLRARGIRLGTSLLIFMVPVALWLAF